jgi:SH3-like domain-containing protein
MRRLFALAGVVGVVLGLATACRTAPPPPPVAHVPVVPQPAPEAVPAEEHVRVTARRLNVREEPTTKSATTARVKKGEPLTVLGRDGEWVRIKLPDGTAGWVYGRYVEPDRPCPPDKVDAELLSDVPLSFTEGASIGKVVVEATVDAAGNVVSTRVVSDTTGIPELVQRAESEVRGLKFSPPVHNCHPVPFLYTYTRKF